MKFARGQCAFCQRTDTIEDILQRMPKRRTCVCGAIGLSVPSEDTDFIASEALGTFEVTIKPESKGYTMLSLRDLEHAGVEIKGYDIDVPGFGISGVERTMWFRRR